MSTLEIWYVRRGLQLPMQDGDYVEIRAHQHAKGPVPIAALDVATLKHILGSQLFLAHAQRMLQQATEQPDAKERLALLEAALPPPIPKPPSPPLASRAAKNRDIRATLRDRRRQRKP